MTHWFFQLFYQRSGSGACKVEYCFPICQFSVHIFRNKCDIPVFQNFLITFISHSARYLNITWIIYFLKSKLIGSENDLYCLFLKPLKKKSTKEHHFQDEKYKDKIELPIKYTYAGIFPVQKKIKLFYKV